MKKKKTNESQESIIWTENLPDSDPYRFMVVARGAGYKYLIAAEPLYKDPRGKAIWATMRETDLIEAINLIAGNDYYVKHIDPINPMTKKDWQLLKEFFPRGLEEIDLKEMNEQLIDAVNRERYEYAEYLKTKISIAVNFNDQTKIQ
jgi:hypothetical protein